MMRQIEEDTNEWKNICCWVRIIFKMSYCLKWSVGSMKCILKFQRDFVFYKCVKQPKIYVELWWNPNSESDPKQRNTKLMVSCYLVSKLYQRYISLCFHKDNDMSEAGCLWRIEGQLIHSFGVWKCKQHHISASEISLTAALCDVWCHNGRHHIDTSPREKSKEIQIGKEEVKLTFCRWCNCLHRGIKGSQ